MMEHAHQTKRAGRVLSSRPVLYPYVRLRVVCADMVGAGGHIRTHSQSGPLLLSLGAWAAAESLGGHIASAPGCLCHLLPNNTCSWC